jgi:hypothetical protein
MRICQAAGFGREENQGIGSSKPVEGRVDERKNFQMIKPRIIRHLGIFLM